MNPEEIKELIQKTIHGSLKYNWIYLVLSVLVGIIITVAAEFLKTKGQNLATKQDIEKITTLVEQVKAQIQNGREIEKLKRELKYKALLSSLNLIDAAFSHTLRPSPGQVLTRQYATIEDARACHNNLILTCENPKIISLFVIIMDDFKDKNQPTIVPTDLLNQYRNLVRIELGFGTAIELDRERAWLGKVSFEK